MHDIDPYSILSQDILTPSSLIDPPVQEFLVKISIHPCILVRSPLLKVAVQRSGAMLVVKPTIVEVSGGVNFWRNSEWDYSNVETHYNKIAIGELPCL
jgi:hypothetical protein